MYGGSLMSIVSSFRVGRYCVIDARDNDRGRSRANIFASIQHKVSSLSNGTVIVRQRGLSPGVPRQYSLTSAQGGEQESVPYAWARDLVDQRAIRGELEGQP